MENLPTFIWGDVDGETPYAVWLINKGIGAFVYADATIAADSTMSTLPGGNELAAGKYRFWINSISTNGYSLSGAPTDFTVGSAVTPPAAPTNLSTTVGPLTIHQDDVNGATSYSIYLINRATNTLVASQTGLGDNSYDASALPEAS